MKNIVLLFIPILLVLSACNDNKLLNQDPHTLSEKSFYTTVNGATQGLNAAYDILQLGEHVERIEFLGTVCSGDAICGGEPGGNDQPDMQQAMKFQTVSTNLYMSAYWNTIYTGIYRCNVLLSYLEKPDELIDFPEKTRNELMGQALFLRGLFHFKLQIFFGGYPQLQKDFNNKEKGVPFIDHVLLPSEWNQNRPTVEETWSKIEDDFKQAATLLPKAYQDPADLGRATWGAAESMLAKSYLFTEDWQDAYDAAKQVINSGIYQLMGEDGTKYKVSRYSKNGMVDVWESGYQFIWQAEANNCPESIFDVQHYADGLPGTADDVGEGNIITQYMGPRRVWTWSTGFYTSTEYYWGFILPTPYFINTAYKDVGSEVNGKILDPRYKCTVMGPTDSVPYRYDDAAMRAQYSDSSLFDAWGNWPSTGYSTWKYFLGPHPVGSNRASWYENPQNTKYLRFADLLLIGAEAAVHVNQKADALTWINRVRTRARNCGNTGYPQNLTDVSLKNIYAERRVELAFEGHQFFDIVRTHRAQQIIKQDAMQYPQVTNPNDGRKATIEFGDQFQVGKNEIFPIPQTEVDVTEGSVTQNPGYSN